MNITQIRKPRIQLRTMSREKHIRLICMLVLYFTWFGVILTTVAFLAYIGIPYWTQIAFALLAAGSFFSLLYLFDFVGKKKE